MAGQRGQGSVPELGLTCPHAQEFGVHPRGKAKGALRRAAEIGRDYVFMSCL